MSFCLDLYEAGYQQLPLLSNTLVRPTDRRTLFRFIRQHSHVIIADFDESARDVEALRLAA